MYIQCASSSALDAQPGLIITQGPSINLKFKIPELNITSQKPYVAKNLLSNIQKKKERKNFQ